MKGISLGSYLDIVNKKLQGEETKRLLMFGKINPKLASAHRDDTGYRSTCENILQTATNLFNMSREVDAVAGQIANFANDPGFSDVNKVTTIGAIDVTIYAMSNSIIPFVAIDRGMATPQDTIYYQNLIAMNSAGGVTAGDIVSANFAPANTNVTLGLPGVTSSSVTGTGAAATITFSNNFVPGQVVVTIVNGATTYIGQDYQANGKIFFESYPGAAVTVNYVDKTVSTTDLTSTYVMTAAVSSDLTKDASGAGTLRVTADWVPTQLTTAPREIILESNLLNNAYMNKTSRFAGASSSQDYADVAFNRMSNVYIEAMNVEVLQTLVGRTATERAVHTGRQVYLDLSSYDVSKFAQTKNDIVSQFIISMKSKFLSRTGVAPSVILAGTNGISLLQGHGDKWVENPDAARGLNGLSGYYDGVPCFRHNFFDRIGSAGYADFYLATKFLDNSVGSLAFGEFLPLTHTGNISNFLNPMHIANGFFSQVGSCVIKAELIQKGQIKLPAVMSVF